MPENVQDNRMIGKGWMLNKSDKISQEMVSGVETRSMKVAQSSNEVKEAKLIADYLNDCSTNKSNKTQNTQVSNENRLNLKQEQESDTTLNKVRELAIRPDDKKEETFFFSRNDILCRHFQGQNDEMIEQIAVPSKHRSRIMQLAHDRPLGGHLGNKKTREKILNHFYWP